MNNLSVSQLNKFLEETSKQDLLLMLQEKTHEIVELKKSNEVWDKIKTSGADVDMAEAAKILKYPGIGRNKLMAILRDAKYLRHNNEPYQHYIDTGLLNVILTDQSEKFGHCVVIPKPMVTAKGLEKIKELLDGLDNN